MRTERATRERAAGELLDSLYRDRVPVALLDQAESALAENSVRFDALTAASCDIGETQRYEVEIDRARTVVLMAALARCEPCAHLAAGPRPAVAALSLDLVWCLDCVDVDAVTPAGREDECDFCEGRGNVVFTTFFVRFGAASLIGDAGDCCAKMLESATLDGA